MNGEAEASHSGLAAGLRVASMIYSAAVWIRETAYSRGFLKSKRLACMVISVGNLSVGGTGKTPMTIYLARLIRSMGYKVVVVSRGYGGKAEKKGGVVCDGRNLLMSSEESGDEPAMMANQLKSIPVMVGRDRFRSGTVAIKRFDPDIILLDDGFQHRRLNRDMDIVLMDAEKPLGNGYLLPRGSLRESKTALKRCHAVVFTRTDKAGALPFRRFGIPDKNKPVFQSSQKVNVAAIVKAKSSTTHCNKTADRELDSLSGKKVHAFSGIARNDDFINGLEKLGCRVARFSAFPDHYRYSHKDMKQIASQADLERVDCIVTTEKDYFRIPRNTCFSTDLIVLGTQIHFKDNDFDFFIRSRLAAYFSKKRNAHI